MLSDAMVRATRILRLVVVKDLRARLRELQNSHYDRWIMEWKLRLSKVGLGEEVGPEPELGVLTDEEKQEIAEIQGLIAEIEGEIRKPSAE